VRRRQGTPRLIIQKFGGTSVEDGPAMERLAAIVSRAASERPAVVVSAMGKTTNRLVEALDFAVAGDERSAVERVSRVRRDTLATVQEFFGRDAERVARRLAGNFEELDRMTRAVAALRLVPPASRDQFLAHGELVASVVAVEALALHGLPAVWVDAREVLITDVRFGRAQPDFAEIARRAEQRIVGPAAQGKIPVLGGFIGATRAGQTTTLGRGGSDYSAAIFGAAVGASAVEIWTDVDGMMTADPQVVPEARVIERISSEEASELAYFGARVLHPLTLAPAIEKGIPVRIRNSRHPERPGTEIRPTVPAGDQPIRSIAFKRGITTLDVVTSRMLMASGFLRTLFDVFARHETSVDMVATSEISVSVTVDDASRLPEIRREIEELASVEVAGHRAVVCLVGQDLKFTAGLAGRVFRAVERINLLMISQGASRRNISFVIEEKDVEEAVRKLHREFFG
jgi:aspartate kinase